VNNIDTKYYIKSQQQVNGNPIIEDIIKVENPSSSDIAHYSDSGFIEMDR
jgi:hypothetical protein